MSLIFSAKSQLSNSYVHKFTYKGKKFSTVWHCFYYRKFKKTDKEWAEKIRNTETIMQVQMMAEFKKGDHKSDPNWNDKQELEMDKIVRKKFEHKTLIESLMKTDDKILGEDSNDMLWGYAKGKGKNVVGKILMNIRKEQDQEDSEPEIVVESDPEIVIEDDDELEIIIESDPEIVEKPDEEKHVDKKSLLMLQKSSQFLSEFKPHDFKVLENFSIFDAGKIDKSYSDIYVGNVIKNVPEFNSFMEDILNTIKDNGSIYVCDVDDKDIFDVYGFYYHSNFGKYMRFYYGTKPVKKVTFEDEKIEKPIKVVKLKKKEGKLVESCDVYIGRQTKAEGFDLPQSKWYCPFKLGENDCETQEKLEKKYEQYVINTDSLLSSVHELEGKRLGFYKKDDKMIAEVLTRLSIRMKLNAPRIQKETRKILDQIKRKVDQKVKYQEMDKKIEIKQQKTKDQFKKIEKESIAENKNKDLLYDEEQSDVFNEDSQRTTSLPYDPEMTQSLPDDVNMQLIPGAILPTTSQLVGDKEVQPNASDLMKELFGQEDDEVDEKVDEDDIEIVEDEGSNGDDEDEDAPIVRKKVNKVNKDSNSQSVSLSLGAKILKVAPKYCATHNKICDEFDVTCTFPLSQSKPNDEDVLDKMKATIAMMTQEDEY